jgi:hypothetical protein
MGQRVYKSNPTSLSPLVTHVYGGTDSNWRQTDTPAHKLCAASIKKMESEESLRFRINLWMYEEMNNPTSGIEIQSIFFSL